MEKNKKNILSVRIISLGEVIWEGQAVSISAVNTTGPFDILPQHANFISILIDNPITLKTETETKKFKFSRSLLYAKDNSIKIYAEI